MSTIRLKDEYESENISKEIDLVINHRVPRIRIKRSSPLNPEVQNTFLRCLVEIPHRTYLWLHLILKVIRKSLDSTTIQLERLINRLSRMVEDAYEKILMIDDSESAKHARRLFHFVVATAGPLILHEVNIALAIGENLERGESCHSYDDLDLESEEPFRDKVRNLCGLFVSIIDSKAYLIHQTAAEFLISQNPFCMAIKSSSLVRKPGNTP
ncbi:hypothetical protein MMC22_011144 [Lobaria immixta]|nr:hypothetical protein [Lobaria immixta]